MPLLVLCIPVLGTMYSSHREVAPGVGSGIEQCIYMCRSTIIFFLLPDCMCAGVCSEDSLDYSWRVLYYCSHHCLDRVVHPGLLCSIQPFPKTSQTLATLLTKLIVTLCVQYLYLLWQCVSISMTDQQQVATFTLVHRSHSIYTHYLLRKLTWHYDESLRE